MALSKSAAFRQSLLPAGVTAMSVRVFRAATRWPYSTPLATKSAGGLIGYRSCRCRPHWAGLRSADLEAVLGYHAAFGR